MFQGFLNKKDKKKGEDFFIKNGAAVLEKLISLHNGDCNPIRSYSAQQLRKATGDFRWKIHQDSYYKLYKGVHEDREILVQKYEPGKYYEGFLEEIANGVAMASRMSNHKNVLKLLGYCLETELPWLVYEFPKLGNLENHIYTPKDNQLPWEHKLRIVIGIANAVAYLHYGLSKTIIHRDINPYNIFVDENHTAKLFQFELAIPIPEGETHVEVEFTAGTLGFLPMEVFVKKRLTEKTDVYAFGVLLLEVLTGKRNYDILRRHEVIRDYNSLESLIWTDDLREKIAAEYCDTHGQENRAQVTEYVKLFSWCVKEYPEERPNMIEVEKALRLIKTI